MAIMDLFKVVVLVQLFYAFSITIVAHSLPAETLAQATRFQDISEEINLQNVGNDVQETIEKQANLPLIEIGAIIFYSGNIIIDLLLNFAFAIPQMIGLLVYGITSLFSIDTYIVAYVELFFSVVMMVLYFLGIIELLTAIRSRGTTVA